MSSGGHPAFRRNLAVWVALLVLLAASVGSAYLPLGIWNSVANLAIAAVKVGLVAVFFMHLREAGGVVRLAAAIGIFMLVLLFGLGATDYLTRRMVPAPWQEPRQLTEAMRSNCHARWRGRSTQRRLLQPLVDHGWAVRLSDFTSRSWARSPPQTSNRKAT